MYKENFSRRHIGPSTSELNDMLKIIGVKSIEDLLSQTIPEKIRLKSDLDIPDAISEMEFLKEIKRFSTLNRNFKTYIGLGYHDTFTPSVIQRNILENPGWYTAYTPYQAEIAQGRLEALLNFQTMVTDLTGMEISNASLLDESTAAAEAMTLLFSTRSRNQKKENINSFFVSADTFPQTLALLETRARPLGIKLEIAELSKFNPKKNYFGAFFQYPALSGNIVDI